MYDGIDVSNIVEASITAFVGGGISWLFWQTRKNAKDMNAAFRQIRSLEDDSRERKQHERNKSLPD